MHCITEHGAEEPEPLEPSVHCHKLSYQIRGYIGYQYESRSLHSTVLDSEQNVLCTMLSGNDVLTVEC